MTHEEAREIGREGVQELLREVRFKRAVHWPSQIILWSIVLGISSCCATWAINQVMQLAFMIRAIFG